MQSKSRDRFATTITGQLPTDLTLPRRVVNYSLPPYLHSPFYHLSFSIPFLLFDHHTPAPFAPDDLMTRLPPPALFEREGHAAWWLASEQRTLRPGKTENIPHLMKPKNKYMIKHLMNHAAWPGERVVVRVFWVVHRG